jgi:hypothetical protein
VEKLIRRLGSNPKSHSHEKEPFSIRADAVPRLLEVVTVGFGERSHKNVRLKKMGEHLSNERPVGDN